MTEEKNISFLRSQRLSKFKHSNKSRLSIFTKKFNHDLCNLESFNTHEKEIYDYIVKLKDEYNEKMFSSEDFSKVKKIIVKLLLENTFIEFTERVIYAEDFNDEKRRYIDCKYKPFTNIPHPKKRYCQ